MAKRDDRDEDLIEEDVTDEAEEEEQEEEYEEDEYEEEEGEEYEEESSRRRLIPALVLTAVVLGFGALAWHSYRTGTESVKEGDVMLVEADNAPLKEKPADPGGMKFPHQDKTVFDTIASNQPKPAPVERVLPPAEEPVNIAAATPSTETRGWVNDKLQEQPTGVGEQASVTPSAQHPNMVSTREAIALGEKSPSAGGPAPLDSTVKEEAAPVDTPAPVAAAPAASAPASKPVEVKEAPVKAVATHEKPAKPAEAPKKAAAAPAAKPVIAEKKKEEAKAAKPAAGGGAGVIQLGAYKSEDEAKKEWDKLSKKYGSILSDKTVYYVKAELPKGTFYRLRASGFKDAKAACAELSAQKQACMPVNGK